MGNFTKYDRTTHVHGLIANWDVLGAAAVTFDAYAGTAKVNSAQAYGDPDGRPGIMGPYDLTVGDTNRVGGIDRIKVTVCTMDWTWCGASVNYNKPGT